MIPRSSLAKRLLFWVISVALMGICALGTTAYFISKEQVINNVGNQIETLSQQAALSLSAFFRQRTNDLETVSESPLFSDYHNNLDFGLVHEAETYRKEIENYLLKFCRRVSVYTRLIYVNEEGRELCKIERGAVASSRNFFPDRQILDQVRRMPSAHHFESSFRIDDPSEPSVIYAKPLYTANQFKGMMVLECSLKPVIDILDHLNIGRSGWACLTDSNGTVQLGRSTNESRNSKRLVRYTPIAGTSWKVSISANIADFLDPLDRIKYITTFFGILCGLMVVVPIYFKVRTLMNPIQILVKTARRLAQGDLAARVPSTKNEDEIGTLSKAFNTMAQSLEQRTNELEGRIRQLTALREMEGAVIQRQDEDTILRNCIKAVAKGFQFDRTGLYWIDHQNRMIVGRHLYGTEQMGFLESSFRKRRTPLNPAATDILNQVIRTRSSVLVKDSSRDWRMNPIYAAESKTKTFVMAPICGKDRVFGVLTADNYYSQRPLEELDKEGLTLFANAIGLALENVLLFQHLTESEARYRTVLENSPVAIIGLSKEQWITTWNRGAEQIFGYREAEIIGKPVPAIFHSNSGDEWRRLFAEVLSKGSVRDYPMSATTKGGRELDLSVSWGGAFQDFWMNKEWSLVIRDVTEAKRFQQQIIRSEKLSAVGQLLSSIAHELNNPLQAVIGYAQLLSLDHKESARPSDEEKPVQGFQDDLRMIVDNSLRCRKIIDNLLMFVRHGKIEKRPMKIQTAIRAAMELLEYKLKKSETVEVELRLSSHLPPIKGDLQQIQQIFVNLINNACDAMAAKTAPKKITIEAREMNSNIRVEITDTGPGIPEKDQERLFEPFFTTKPEGRGTGLGLTVCRQIVEDHQGRMGFRSVEGEAAVFWIDLPTTQETGTIPTSNRMQFPKSHKRRILVVDDEPNVLSLLAKVVIGEGHRAKAALTLQEARLKISQNMFDLVITDLRLGNGTGLDLYQNWGFWSGDSRPPFLFLTGDVLNAAMRQEIESRGLPLLLKPVDLESIQQMIRRLLSEPELIS